MRRGLIAAEDVQRSARRLRELRGWLSDFGEPPPLAVVGSAEHGALADELARRSITLLRDEARLLPLRPAPDARLAVIMPRPADLTPADTSSYARAGLAELIRRRHSASEAFLIEMSPQPAEIAALRLRLADFDLLVLATVSAHLHPGQAELARALLELGRPTVTVALRTPWDLGAYPAVGTHLCTYGLLEPSLEALAGVLWGDVPARGRLPVKLGRLYPRRHGLTLQGAAA